MKKSHLTLVLTLLNLIIYFPARTQNPYQYLDRAQLAQSLQVPIKIAYGGVKNMGVRDWEDLRDEYQPLTDAYFSAADLPFASFLEAVAAYQDSQQQADPEAALARWNDQHPLLARKAAAISEELQGRSVNEPARGSQGNDLDDLLEESMEDVRSIVNNLGDFMEEEDMEEIRQSMDLMQQITRRDLSTWNMGSFMELLDKHPELLEEGLDEEADDVYEWFEQFYTDTAEQQTEENFEPGGSLPYQDMKGILYQTAASGHSYLLRRAKDKGKGAATVYNFRLTAKSELLNQHRILRQIVQAEKTPDISNLYDQWLRQKQKVQALYNKPADQRRFEDLSPAEDELIRLERRLIQAIPGAGEEPTRPSWQDIQQKLTDQQAAIEVIRFPNHEAGADNNIFYAALIIKKGLDYPISTIIGGDQLEEQHFPAYHQKKNDDRLGSIFYEVFWEPIQEQLSGIEQVYLSTDGIYHSINFNILPWPDGRSFLLDHLQVKLVNSTGDLLREKPAASPKVALLAGAPDYAAADGGAATHPINSSQLKLSEDISTNWGALPSAAQEVGSIGALLEEQGYTVELHIGAAAKESLIKGQHPSILHLATHGFFLESKYKSQEARMLEPYQSAGSTRLFKMSRSIVDSYYGMAPDEIDPMLRSGLVFAGGNRWSAARAADREDGILLAYEVGTLNLSNTELIVLSGCDTGQGEIVTGEGMNGLQQAFKVAGAQSLIMSLWPVPDQVAQQFLGHFYQSWLRDGMSRSAAFATAQKQVRSDWERPIYWGAFIYMEL